MKPRLKFKHQLALTYTLGIIVLATSITLVVSNLTNRAVKSQLIAQGKQVTLSLADRSKLPLLYQSDQLFLELAETAFNFPGVVGISIYDNEGKVLFSEGTGAESSSLEIHSVNFEQIEDTDTYWSFFAPVNTSKLSNDVLDSVYEPTDEEDQTRLGAVRVALSKGALKNIQSNVFAGSVYVSTTIAAVLLLFVYLVFGRMISPVERLSQVMKRGVEDNHNVRSMVGGPIELQDMQLAFNSLMESLEARERELVRAMNMALESARVKGEFAANVTHELRTPMNAVLGMMDLLLTMGLNDKQREYVEIAKVSGEGLLQLIDEVLCFAELDSEDAAVETSDCLISELLDDVIGLLASQAMKNGLDLGYVIADNVPAFAKIDSPKVKQILINLVGNAIKFTKIGQVAVRVELASAENNSLKITVSDTGIGIPKDSLKIIFDAFRQADSSSRKEYGGTGLGLAISKQLTELMGGTLSVTSEVGEGSSFTFALPVETSELIVNSSNNDFLGMRAVVVDDSPVVRDFAHTQLEKLGIEATCFDGGLSALEYLRKQSAENKSKIDVVFVDETMEKLKGNDLLRFLLEDGFGQHSLLVLLSNPWRESPRIDSNEIVVLQKPLRSDSFVKCLDKHMNKRDQQNSPQPEVSGMVPKIARPILVVDDNVANQKVARGMLERLGAKVECVENGKEAVEAVVRQSFSLVFMDCYMPLVDGYEATRQIRQYEGDGSRLPIVAMTANNSAKEADKCFEAGMDDFMPKPLRINTLKEKLSTWMAREHEKTHAPTPAKPVDNNAFSPPVDSEAMKELRDSVGEVAASIIEAFLEDTPVYLQSIKLAITSGDYNQIRDLAHTIKGSASNFGAHQLMSLCKQIESASAEEDEGAIKELMEDLKDNFHLVRKALDIELDELQPEEKTTAEEYRLLVVDDDRSMRLALRSVFKGHRYLIEEAANGGHAIEQCKRNMPDLILMDAMMPGIDGFDTCKSIRQLTYGNDVPILMVTALDNESSITKAFESGATDYIPKPIHFSVLRQRVDHMIRASKTEKHVRKLAYNDSLTGLPNRSSLMQHMRVVLNRCSIENSEMAVLFMDLDRFKLINDTLGHATGDLLLKAVAGRIRGCVREQDFVARLGGDEFTVVLENIPNRKTVQNIAEKICNSISQPFVFLQQTMFLTTSVGISIYPADGEDVGTLIKHADSAMFGAKEKGNDYCFYREGMEDEIARRLELERDLRHAIEHDDLTLHYQPKFELVSGQMTGVEALIRWRHEKLGLLSPAEFIPLAEETDLIKSLGDWVLRESINQASQWRDEGFDLTVAVNLSGKELSDSGIHEKLSSLLNQHDLPADRLELEITESILMENPEKNESELSELKKMGVTLTIDDFGTGFSSLSYLKRLPVNTVKIDRSFVNDLETDNNDRAIVSGIIALAGKLGLRTIAEGVETKEQKEILTQLGCDAFQGFLASKPLPADELKSRYLMTVEAERS